MMDPGYPLHLIDLLAKLYRKQPTKEKVAGTLSQWFRVKKGVRQGKGWDGNGTKEERVRKGTASSVMAFAVPTKYCFHARLSLVLST